MENNVIDSKYKCLEEGKTEAIIYDIIVVPYLNREISKEVTELEHNTSDGTHNSLVKVDDDTVALAYASTSDVGNIATFTITSDGATITEVYDVEHDSSQAKSNSLIKI